MSSHRREPAVWVALTMLGCTPPGADPLLDETGDGDGDSDGDETVGTNDVPFELVSAAMDLTGEFVALRFSEPVGPLDGVDPSDFRISVALPYELCSGGEDCVAKTGYWDANFYVDYYLTYAPYGPPESDRFEVDLLAHGNMPTDVVLRFAVPLDPLLCEYFEDAEVLFVHFAPAPIPVQSDDGEPLAAIGPQWVDYVGPIPFMGVDGDFPNLDPRIPIPCP